MYILQTVQIAERESNRQYGVNIQKESTNYELNLDFSGASFSVRWFNVGFVRNGTRVVRLRKSIAVPKNRRYTEANFKKAEPWELEIILQIESVMFPIRNQLISLMKAHYNILMAAKSGGIKINTMDLRERVTPKEISIKMFKENRGKR